MTKALAESRAADMKAAQKKIAAKGVTKPRHDTLTSKTPKLVSVSPDIPLNRRSVFPDLPTQGVDNDPDAVVHSDQDVKPDGLQPQEPQGESKMTETAQVSDLPGVAKAAAMKAEKEAQKAETKRIKDEAAAAAKAEKDAAAAAKAEKTAADKAEKLAKIAAERAERAEKTAAERTARIAEGGGAMSALARANAAGRYTKGVNGQLRSSDELALALESIPAKSMVPFLLKVQGFSVNQYATLNYGQQSMNLRNRLRGAIKAGRKAEGSETVITLDYIKSVRDEGNWTAEAPKTA